MADHTITISNSINCFGQGPSTKWGAGSPYTMTWGSSQWGEGTQDLIQDVEKVVSNSISEPTTTFYFDVVKLVDNSLSVTSETTSEGLKSGSWSYVFSSDTTDADNRTLPSYTSGSAGSQSWSTATTGSVTWS